MKVYRTPTRRLVGKRSRRWRGWTVARRFDGKRPRKKFADRGAAMRYAEDQAETIAEAQAVAAARAGGQDGLGLRAGWRGSKRRMAGRAAGLAWRAGRRVGASGGCWEREKNGSGGAGRRARLLVAGCLLSDCFLNVISAETARGAQRRKARGSRKADTHERLENTGRNRCFLLGERSGGRRRIRTFVGISQQIYSVLVYAGAQGLATFGLLSGCFSRITGGL